MRILFIWPNLDTFGCKPMGLSLLMAELMRAGHDVDLFDTTFYDLGTKDYNQELTDRGYFKPVDYGVDVGKKQVNVYDELDEKIQSFNPDIFAISILSDEVDFGIKLANHLKEAHWGNILVGNKGAEKMQSMYPAENITYFIGESIGFIEKFIYKKFFKSTSITYSPGYYKELDKLPFVDWSHFDPRHFLRAYDGKVYRSGDHMIGWGCVNSCTYCINEHWRKLHGGMFGCLRLYSVERIIDELGFLKDAWNLEFFKFHDEDFLLKPLKYFEELSREYGKCIGLPFACMTNAKSVTPQKIDLLKKMGCVSVSIGIETGNDIMRSMLNRRESKQDIVIAVNLLQSARIRVSAFNMIGLPYETEKTIEETIVLNKAAGVKNPNVSFFIPLEGTRLYDISVAAGFFKPGDSVSTNQPSLKLPGISKEKLLYYYDNFHKLVTE